MVSKCSGNCGAVHSGKPKVYPTMTRVLRYLESHMAYLIEYSDGSTDIKIYGEIPVHLRSQCK